MQSSDQQLTDQEPQPKAKHAGGRPRKPKPAPPLAPPAPYSLEETLIMGDQAAAKGTPAARLRWVSQRALLVKEIQARKEADCHGALEIEKNRLQESIEAFEKTRKSFENELGKRDRDLVAAKTEKDSMAAKLEEWAEKYAKLVEESTYNMRASERKSKGQLAIVRYVCSQMEGHSEGQRIEYAARLMRFSEEAFKQAQHLAGLVKNREAHREHHAARCWNSPRGPVEQKLSDEQFAQVKKGVEEKIERSMQADRERLEIEFSNWIPDEVLNQAFELLGVTREQVVHKFVAEQEQRKA